MAPHLAMARSEVAKSRGGEPVYQQAAEDIFSGLFEFQEDADLIPREEYINGRKVEDSERRTMHFSKSEPVALEELNDGTFALSALLPDQEKLTTPNRIVVSRSELKRAKLNRIGAGNADDLERQFTAYPPVEVASRGHYHMRGRQHYRGYGGCVAYVCQHVGCNGPVGNGVGMTHYLARRGWTRVSCANASAGSVASWSGGHGGRGHTAILTGSGWCYDLGCETPGRGYGGMNCVAPSSAAGGGWDGWGG